MNYHITFLSFPPARLSQGGLLYLPSLTSLSVACPVWENPVILGSVCISESSPELSPPWSRDSPSSPPVMPATSSPPPCLTWLIFEVEDGDDEIAEVEDREERHP